MNEHDILVEFRKNKIMTIKRLIPLLQCSAITVRRRLKKWETYTSINQNGRYYTLPDIPKFDGNGLWKYEFIIFSKHGNLKQTIVELIKNSEMGLSAVDISKIIEISSSSSYFSQLNQSIKITREKHQGRFIYFSAIPSRYQQQKEKIELQGVNGWPTDAQAVKILVYMMKNPGIEVERVAIESAPPGNPFDPFVVKHFLQFHDLLKKTPDTEH